MISELVVFWEFWIEVRKYRDGFGLCIFCVVVYLGPVGRWGRGICKSRMCLFIVTQQDGSLSVINEAL